MTKTVDGSNLGYLIGKIRAAFWAKGDTSELTIDATPTSASDNLVKSGGVYSFVKPATGSSQPAGGLAAGVLYNLGTLSGSVTISLAAPADASVENEYKLTFDADSTAPTITWPVGVTAWAGNCLDGNGDPELTAGKHYEVSIVGAYGVIVEF